MKFGTKAAYLLQYLRQGKTKYYLHSPFIYQFYLNVLEGYVDADAIEQLRFSIAAKVGDVAFNDLGKDGIRQEKSFKELASQSATTRRYGRVLYRAANYFKPAIIIELGTNIGIGTAYLAHGNPDAHVYTIEGSAELQQIAIENHLKLGISNVEYMCGDFASMLPGLLSVIQSIDMLYIDGHHKYQPTIDYFEACLPKMNENSVIIIDDIYWSEEMANAWTYIKQHPAVTLSVDIYRMGFVFLRPQQLAKEHFRLYYI